jgi:4-carboxymuconolactone decarboxylase
MGKTGGENQMDQERFAPLTAETMTPDQQRVADEIAGGPRGSLRGPFQALLRSPDLADRVQRLGEFIRFHSSIPTRLNEMAILMVARKWTAQYEFYAHRQVAMAAGLNPAVADAIALGQRPADLQDDESAVYAFAAALLDTGQVPDDAFAAVERLFGEVGVVDLIGTLGYYGLVSMVLNVHRYPLPDGVAPPLAEPKGLSL